MENQRDDEDANKIFSNLFTGANEMTDGIAWMIMKTELNREDSMTFFIAEKRCLPGNLDFVPFVVVESWIGSAPGDI